MADMKAQTGSNQYNVLKWLEKQEHKITKDKESGIITVVPKAEAAQPNPQPANKVKGRAHIRPFAKRTRQSRQ